MRIADTIPHTYTRVRYIYTTHVHAGGGDQMRITGFMHPVDCIVCGVRIERMARCVVVCVVTHNGTVESTACRQKMRIFLLLSMFLTIADPADPRTR